MKILQSINYFNHHYLTDRKSVIYSHPIKGMIYGAFLIFFTLAGIFYSPELQAQTFQVSGKITHAGSGDPLPGVTIKEKGTDNGTTTEADGKFRLQVSNGESRLIIRHVGFISETVGVNGRNTLDIKLAESVKELDQVVVTATRSEKEVEQLPYKIEIVDNQEINNTIGNDIADVLKKNAGVDVIQYPGLISGIGIRGFRPDPFGGVNQRALTLIDGRPAGATNMALIGLQNIERIEVQKGPASALYGSQAMGGVINIITKESEGPVEGKANLEYGSFNTVKASFGSGGNITPKLDYDMSFSYFERGNDFRIGEGNLFRDMLNAGEAKNIFHAGDSTVMIDDTIGDGEKRPNTTYDRYAGSLRLGYQLTENWKVNIKGDRFFANRVNSPGDIRNGVKGQSLKDVNRNSGDVTLDGQIGEHHNLMFRGYAASEIEDQFMVNATDTTNLVQQYPSGQNNWQWRGFQGKDVFEWQQHSLTVGIDYNDVKFTNQRFNPDGSNAIPYNPNYGLTTTGIYAQTHFNFFDEKLNVILGGRYENINYEILQTELLGNEHSAESNNTVNPSLGVKYHLLESLSLRATYGTGFTTHDAFYLAGYDQQMVFGSPGNVTITEGNPNLENVKSSTWEAGISYHPEVTGLSLDATWFQTRLSNNPIQVVNTLDDVETTEAGDTIQSINTYVNADASHINGLEFNAAYDFGALQDYEYSLKLYANSVFINKAREVRDVYAVGEMESKIHNVADATVNFGISYDNFDWLNLRLSGRYVGNRFDRNWNYFASLVEIEYPAFMVMDFVGKIRLDEQKHEFMVKIGNITGENYYEKRGFNLPGRNYHVGYTYNF